MTTYYKVLNADLSGTHTVQRWDDLLPTADGPGPWTDPVEELVHCMSGWHVAVGEKGLLEWLGDRVFIAQVDGPHRVVYVGKVPCHRIRLVSETLWDDQRARLFGADCAARALALLLEPDPRSVRAVEVARLYAHGEASDDDRGAALLAARHALSAAAWAAVAAAEHSPCSRAVGAAAGYATMDAEVAAAERAWQADRLRAYLHDATLPDPVPLPEVVS